MGSEMCIRDSGLIKPPKSQRLPDIVTVEETQRLFAATRVVSYRERKKGLAHTSSDIWSCGSVSSSIAFRGRPRGRISRRCPVARSILSMNRASPSGCP